MENEESVVSDETSTETEKVGEKEVETTATKENEVKKEDLEETKPYTQSQINDMVRNRLDNYKQSIFNRYSVKDRDELDELIGKALSYNLMDEELSKVKQELKEKSEKLLFLDNNVNPTRYEDVKTYFKGLEKELSDEELKAELETHPEWLNVVKVDDKPKTTIEINSTKDNKFDKPTESDEMAKMFGIKNFI